MCGTTSSETSKQLFVCLKLFRNLHTNISFPPGDIPHIEEFDTDPPGKQNIQTGGTLKIFCTATGEPQPKYSWWFSSEATDASSTVLPNENDPVLVIKDAKKQDHQGSYYCRVTNVYRDVKSHSLSIKVGEYDKATQNHNFMYTHYTQGQLVPIFDW